MTPPVTEFVLIRHGETAWNAEGRIQGQLDIPLNARGLAQAEALGQCLGAEKFDAMYSSDLQRAHRTALPLAQRSSGPILPSIALREQHLGILQGLTGSEAKARHAGAWTAFANRLADETIEGGESLTVFSRRISEFIQDCLTRHAGQRLLMVTHGGVLDVLYRQIHGKPLNTPRDFPVFNASINVLRHQEGAWSVARWGNIDHLAREGAMDDL